MHHDARWDYPRPVLTLLLYLIQRGIFASHVYDGIAVSHSRQSEASSGNIMAQIVNYQFVGACNNAFISFRTNRVGRGLRYRIDPLNVVLMMIKHSAYWLQHVCASALLCFMVIMFSKTHYGFETLLKPLSDCNGLNKSLISSLQLSC